MQFAWWHRCRQALAKNFRLCANPLGIGIEAITVAIGAGDGITDHDRFTAFANLVVLRLADDFSRAFCPGCEGFVVRHGGKGEGHLDAYLPGLSRIELHRRGLLRACTFLRIVGNRSRPYDPACMSQTPLPPLPNPDREHLKLLEVFHYVMVLLAVLGMAFLAAHYMFMRNMMEIIEKNPKLSQSPQGPAFDPAVFFQGFIWFYILTGIWGILSLVLNLISAVCIRNRRGRFFSMVVAGINCINMPFGTVLGVFTFIVLLRPSMPALYHETSA